RYRTRDARLAVGFALVLARGIGICGASARARLGLASRIRPRLFTIPSPSARTSVRWRPTTCAVVRSTAAVSCGLSERSRHATRLVHLHSHLERARHGNGGLCRASGSPGRSLAGIFSCRCGARYPAGNRARSLPRLPAAADRPPCDVHRDSISGLLVALGTTLNSSLATRPYGWRRSRSTNTSAEGQK